MFSKSTVLDLMKSGKPSTVKKSSKYQYPCIIQRLPKFSRCSQYCDSGSTISGQFHVLRFAIQFTRFSESAAHLSDPNVTTKLNANPVITC